MCLDKDILLPGNKHYSPELCAFVPKWLNAFISNMKQKDRGELPMGVQKYGNRFIARFGCRGTAMYLGSFMDAESAHAEYLAVRKVEVAKRIDTYSKMPGAIADVVAALVYLLDADERPG
jgi:hypothetical protein